MNNTDENKPLNKEAKNEKPDNSNIPTGKPVSRQDKYCNVLVLIGLLIVIAVGAHNIFRIPAEDTPSKDLQPAELMEETEEEGEPIDEEMMPSTPQNTTVAIDTLTNVDAEELDGDSLSIEPSDTTTISTISSHTGESKPHKEHEASHAKQEHSDSTSTH